MDEFLRALTSRYLPRYETKIALTEQEVTEHGLRRIGDAYQIRHDPPLFGWQD